MSSIDESRDEPITNITQFKNRVFQTIYLDNILVLKEVLETFKGTYDVKSIKDAVGNTGKQLQSNSE